MTGRDDNESGGEDKPLTPEQEQRLRQEIARAEALVEAAAKPGFIGQEPLDQWLLEQARACTLWATGTPEGKRAALIAYATASVHLIRALYPHDPARLCAPWVGLTAGLQDLAHDVTAAWLKPSNPQGTSQSSRQEMARRALLAAAAEQYRRAGFTLDVACEDVGRAAGVDAEHIRGWRKRLLRTDDLQATRDERDWFGRWCAMLAGRAPAEIVTAVREALESLR
jgi:hypothetical protein